MAESKWYQEAVIYELHVRSFFDSNGDGIGDFRGAALKLDYLQDLGVTAIWLLPFYPSPLKDDGYDISDYMDVHPTYGTLQDFKYFLKEAHQRGIRVITELVINHTSSEHPWFQRARQASPGSSERDFYVWSTNSEKYKDARIIFKDFELSNWTWDATAQAYYWHRFYSHQPDLNFDNPEVKKAIFKVLDFWMAMGVDGFRLDAVPYLLEREGTNCENLPETHQFLKTLRKHVDAKFEHKMLLAEANQWPEDAVTYFGSGDECHMAFHFPLMPRLFMAIHMEDRYPIIDILQQTPTIPESCQWALFLRNHDELTLEMVTDEERDYMYRVYAHDPQARINLGIRRRLAPLLMNHRRKIELMNGLLFSMPGTPILYYGDELGMGDNIYLGDRNSVRTPMQWSADRNAGFSQSNPQRLYLPVTIDPEYHYETVNAEAQQNNPHSLLWWMKRLIALRKRYQALSRGSIQFLSPENRKVLVFVRVYQNETILVIANISRFVQYVELDLSKYKGMVPVEMFGHVDFPPIGELPYFVTLGPHAFYWFSLEPSREAAKTTELAPEIDVLQVKENWERVLIGKEKRNLEDILPKFLKARRWFGGKAKKIKRIELIESCAIAHEARESYLNLVRVDFTEGEAETYLLPVAYAEGERAKEVLSNSPHAVIAKLTVARKQNPLEGVLFDAAYDRGFISSIFEAIYKKRKFKAKVGEIMGSSTAFLKRLKGLKPESLEPAWLKSEQSNTSIILGNQLILKLFRRFQEGVNPELEISRQLTEVAHFPNVPPIAGSIEYANGRKEPATFAVLQKFETTQGDAWQLTLDAVSSYCERILTKQVNLEMKSIEGKTPLALSAEEVDPAAAELINPYLEIARLLGQRTGEMHTALSAQTRAPNFTPESFTPFYRRALYQSMRNLTNQVFHAAQRQMKKFAPEIQQSLKTILSKEEEVLKRFQSIVDMRVTALRIRCHGDYHLGQVLYTGKDFMIIDFEGEPARSIQERKIKRSPLRDVAGMLRSFHYAAYTCVSGRSNQVGAGIRTEDQGTLEPYAYSWYLWVSSAFLRSYLQHASAAGFLPKEKKELEVLLNLYTLEKAIYELNYELNNRPDWVKIPIHAVLQLLEHKT